MKKLRAKIFRVYLLPFSQKFNLFSFSIEKYKDKNAEKYNLASLYAWMGKIGLILKHIHTTWLVITIKLE